MPAFAIGMADAVRRPDRGPGLAGHRAHARARQCRRCRKRLITEVMQTVDVAFAEEWKFDHGIMVPLHFLTPKYDLADHPRQHQLPGPAADAAAPRLGLRRGAAPRGRQRARAHRHRRHRRHLALAGHARLRQDQRSLGPRVPGPLVAQRQGRPAVVHRRATPTATPGRAASRSAPSSPGRRRARAGRDPALPADPDLRGELHAGRDGD